MKIRWVLLVGAILVVSVGCSSADNSLNENERVGTVARALGGSDGGTAPWLSVPSLQLTSQAVGSVCTGAPDMAPTKVSNGEIEQALTGIGDGGTQQIGPMTRP